MVTVVSLGFRSWCWSPVEPLLASLQEHFQSALLQAYFHPSGLAEQRRAEPGEAHDLIFHINSSTFQSVNQMEKLYSRKIGNPRSSPEEPNFERLHQHFALNGASMQSCCCSCCCCYHISVFASLNTPFSICSVAPCLL